MTIKIHKNPFKFRLIVCCAGTFMNDWSRWLDYQLQRLKPFIKSYLQDGQQLLNELKPIKLSPNDRIFTADAQAMYHNIDTKHAIKVISWLLDELAPNLPDDFPLEAIKPAMYHIMSNNIFQWGVLFFLQLLGTAMGTSAAVMWATLYFAYHEHHCLLPKYKLQLRYFKRFIDDLFVIWRWDGEETWSEFCADLNNFGILKWDINRPSMQVDFLDLTITINNGKLETKTFQKALNLYLYLPPSSAHPSNNIKSTVYGLVRRYYAQNTHRRDYIYFVKLLYRRLLARGWDADFIKPLIMKACEKAESPVEPTNQVDKGMEDDRLFFHIQSHPDDITAREIQSLYQTHCAETFQEYLGVERLTIAYSRPPNIGEQITEAKFFEAPGQSAADFMGEYKQGLAP